MNKYTTSEILITEKKNVVQSMLAALRIWKKAVAEFKTQNLNHNAKKKTYCKNNEIADRKARWGLQYPGGLAQNGPAALPPCGWPWRRLRWRFNPVRLDLCTSITQA